MALLGFERVHDLSLDSGDTGRSNAGLLLLSVLRRGNPFIYLYLFVFFSFMDRWMSLDMCIQDFVLVSLLFFVYLFFARVGNGWVRREECGWYVCCSCCTAS